MDIETMAVIQAEKAKEISESELMPLDAEGKTVAEQKRFSIDLITIPIDPLR